MPSGIRATVSFGGPANCPVARFAGETGAVIDQVSTSVTRQGSPDCITEFLGPERPVDGTDVWPVFSYGGKVLYRVNHEEGACPCQLVGEYGCPVHRYLAQEGELTLVFHAGDFGTLQELIENLRGRYPSLDVQQLLQPPLSGTPEERVFVNRGTLTDRQHEVLQTAYEMGYFERPKGANATEVASELGISQSTFTEHLMAAHRKLLGDILDRASPTPEGK